MCPAKWQTQYDLTEKTIPVSTQALLPILEKIKNNAELEAKLPSGNKMKGAGEKCRMDLIDLQIPKKRKLVTFSEKYCALCKKRRGPHKSHNTCDCHCFNSNGTPIKRNGGSGSARGADMLKSIAQRKVRVKGLILPRSFERKFGKLSASNPTSARNVVSMNTKVTSSLMTAREGAGQIAQRNQLSVRNLK
jgi:hypothetical protein